MNDFMKQVFEMAAAQGAFDRIDTMLDNKIGGASCSERE